MISKNLADKCRVWVEEYCQSSQSTPQNTPNEVRNNVERRYEIPACHFEMPYSVNRDYHLVNASNVEARIDIKSRLDKLDANSLERIAGQVGGESRIRYCYLFFSGLFCSIIGKKPTYYYDEYAERHIGILLSQLKENAIHKAEAIGAELVVMERDNINLKGDFSGIVHLVTIKLGIEYTFHYHADARAEFYKRNAQ